MSPLLKLSIRIEKSLVRINQTVPAKVWYTILLLVILGSVFLSKYFGPEINSAFAMLWLFALIVVSFGEPRPQKDYEGSYLGLFLGSFLLIVFLVLAITSALHYL